MEPLLGAAQVLACERPQSRASLLLKPLQREREFFIDNLLVQIHLIIEIVLADRPCAIGV